MQTLAMCHLLRYINLREKKNNSAIKYCSYRVPEQSSRAHLLTASSKINAKGLNIEMYPANMYSG